jgi:hypothetical protein
MNSLLVVFVLVGGYFMMSDKSLQNQVKDLQPIHYIGFLIVAVFLCNMNQKEGLCVLDPIPADVSMDLFSSLNTYTHQQCSDMATLWDDNASTMPGAVRGAVHWVDDVDCVETGNTPGDCLADCLPARATVTTRAAGGGTACLGDHTCLDGEGLCVVTNCVETGNTPGDCLASCGIVTATVITPAAGGGTACLGDHTCVSGEGACVVTNCVETGNTADCTADCGTVTATVTTPAANGGTACTGSHTCVGGEGLCVAVDCVETGNTDECLAPAEGAEGTACNTVGTEVDIHPVGGGTACTGEYICLPGDGECPGWGTSDTVTLIVVLFCLAVAGFLFREYNKKPPKK